MISTSAPAKIILVGEHAVVYGEPAIAVPVQGLSVVAQAQPSTKPGLYIEALNTGECLTYTGDDDNSPLLHMAHIVLQALNVSVPDIRITLQSSIPIASGLGSGAAVSTALGRVLALAVGSALAKPELNQLVYAVEGWHHGTPSGIDNTVIVYEQPVYFVRDESIQFIRVGRPFTLLIADTGQQALTRVAVSDVRRLYEDQPAVIKPVITAIGALGQRARTLIEAGNIEALGQIMSENHVLLQKLTVSSTRLDQLVMAAMQAGALGAKLSGGGRGGNMIALVTPETREAVRAALSDAGAAAVYETIVT